MMNKLLRLGLSLLVCFGVTAPSQAQEKLTLDDNHSYVQWKINHLGFSSQTGKWFVTGSVTLDKDKPENSKVEAKIDLSKIVTGLPELDKHLKGSQFFDVANFPVATFVSNKVTVLDKQHAKIEGLLSLHGVTRPVTLAVAINKVGTNPITDQMTVGFTATTVLKRSEFGMTTLIPVLGDEVFIDINAEAYLAKDANATAQP